MSGSRTLANVSISLRDAVLVIGTVRNPLRRGGLATLEFLVGVVREDIRRARRRGVLRAMAGVVMGGTTGSVRVPRVRLGTARRGRGLSFCPFSIARAFLLSRERHSAYTEDVVHQVVYM